MQNEAHARAMIARGMTVSSPRSPLLKPDSLGRDFAGSREQHGKSPVPGNESEKATDRK
jgi:hypothetical protein